MAMSAYYSARNQLPIVKNKYDLVNFQIIVLK